jgi:hypothetical protein
MTHTPTPITAPPYMQKQRPQYVTVWYISPWAVRRLSKQQLAKVVRPGSGTRSTSSTHGGMIQGACSPLDQAATGTWHAEVQVLVTNISTLDMPCFHACICLHSGAHSIQSG